ncbi:hypothetical protein FLAG1_08943 [Fusarium langsethiae]|uniref:Uncharacterized protein n=1 Tax=Fusarium langsethiae TaxID=179993 RepID=A0A0M9ERM2_FUSLA|nr:hypothetical protein FLAG1_08943 [Fusarium langsethiae]GKU06336.1 unnamed protein product [Fusarium langsethiae]
MGAQISVVTSNDATEVANAIFNGPGVSVVGATLERNYWEEDTLNGNRGSAGTFTRGPFGIGSGGILSSGWSRDAKDSSATGNRDTGVDGSLYCGPGSTTNGAVLSVDILVDTGYNGLSVEFVLATDENLQGNADPMGIYLDDVQYALDTSGNRITVNSDYLQQPIGITDNQLLSATMYGNASPLLIMGLAVSPGQHRMIFAICDANNGEKDSALMVKAGGCVDCVRDIKLNYATTTTTVGPTPFVSTIKAALTMSGTVVYGVPKPATTEVTTTTEEAYSTTNADVTSYTEETTSTTKLMSMSEESTPTEPTATADVLSTSTEASTTAEAPTTTDLPTTTGVSSEELTSTDESSTAAEYTTTATATTSNQGSETSSAEEPDTTTTIATPETMTNSMDVSTSSVSTSMDSTINNDSALTTVVATTTSTSQASISTASTFTTIRRPCRP